MTPPRWEAVAEALIRLAGGAVIVWYFYALVTGKIPLPFGAV